MKSLFFGDNRGWGFGLSVFTKRDQICNVPGRFGWDGGYGTSWYSDPTENLTGILLTQRMMDSPQPPAIFADFWTSAYRVIDDDAAFRRSIPRVRCRAFAASPIHLATWGRLLHFGGRW